MSVKLKNIELKYAFAKMKEGELLNFKFLSQFIYDKVGIALNVYNLAVKDHQTMTCWGGIKCKQYPDELAKLLVFIYENRKDIKSFCEIGSERGGTFYVIDSFLRAINPDMGHSLTIDINQHINDFEQYHKETPLAEFLKINSMKFTPRRQYDLAFIDGAHKHGIVQHDYNNMSKCAKILALHDIKLSIPMYNGAKTFWESLEHTNKIELLNEDPRFPVPIGIGILINN